MIPEHCGTEEIANLLNLSKRRVQQLAKHGMPRTGRGQYPVRGCVLWYLDFSKAGPGEGKSQEEQRTELLYEQTIKTRMENEINKSNLFHADEVEASFQTAETLLGSILDAFAPRMANMLAAEHDPSVLKSVLFEECREVRRAYASALKKVGEYMEDSSGDSGAAPTKDSKPVGKPGKDTAPRKPRTRKVAK